MAGFWQVVATVSGVVTLVVLIIGVVVRRFVTPYLQKVLGATQETTAEVKNNGGSSMKDAISRIEESQTRIERHQEDSDRRVNEMCGTVTGVQRDVARLAGRTDVMVEFVKHWKPNDVKE